MFNCILLIVYHEYFPLLICKQLQAPSGAKKFIEKENLQKNYHLYLEKAAQQDESNILG